MRELLTDAQELRDRIASTGATATLDPAQAATSRPCVLVTPPALDHSARTATWQLAALSGHSTGSLAALTELVDLVELVDTVLAVEAATPASYALTPDVGAVPAYLITVTTSY